MYWHVTSMGTKILNFKIVHKQCILNFKYVAHNTIRPHPFNAVYIRAHNTDLGTIFAQSVSFSNGIIMG